MINSEHNLDLLILKKALKMNNEIRNLLDADLEKKSSGSSAVTSASTSPQVNKKDNYYFQSGDGEIVRLKVLNKILREDTLSLLSKVDLKDKVVLEVGCGLGIISSELAMRVGDKGKVCAIDNSEHLLNFAREHAENQGLLNVEFRNMNIYDIDICSFPQKFDVLYGRYIIVNLSNPTEVLDRLLGMLKEGGTIILEEGILNEGFCYPPNAAYQAWRDKVNPCFWKDDKDPTIGLQLHSIFTRKNIKILEEKRIQPLLTTPETRGLVTQSLTNSRELNSGVTVELAELIAGLQELEGQDCVIGSAPTMQIVGKLSM